MKHIVLQPTFYNKFECIGSDCKYNCCRDWAIGITKQELKNMKRKIHTEEFREIFEDAFEKYKFDIFDYKIKFDENEKCKLLDENGLCKVYKEMGPENMSLTCQIFPRSTTYNLGKYECFLSVACEEVVRLLLQEKEGIKLEVIEREVTDAEKKGAPKIDAETIKTNSLFHYWTEIKILLLGVLQNREYSFGERMVVLGMAFKKIDTMMREGVENIKVIPNYIEQFVNDFNDAKNREIFNKLFENIDKNESARKRLFNYITYHYNGSGMEKDIMIQNKINDRIDIKMKFQIKQNEIQNLNIKYNVEKYQKAIADFEEFIKGREYFIENVMIEGFLDGRYPFCIGGGIWKNYCAMALLYSVMLCMWVCCIEKDSTEEDFIQYTSEFSKSIFNNVLKVTTLEEQFNKTESETLAHMAMLVL